MNTYQYPPYNSAHPPSVASSMIYGLLLTYWKQNTYKKDFIHYAKLLFERLQVKGYHSTQLRKIFETTAQKISKKFEKLSEISEISEA